MSFHYLITIGHPECKFFGIFCLHNSVPPGSIDFQFRTNAKTEMLCATFDGVKENTHPFKVMNESCVHAQKQKWKKIGCVWQSASTQNDAQTKSISTSQMLPVKSQCSNALFESHTVVLDTQIMPTNCEQSLNNFEVQISNKNLSVQADIIVSCHANNSGAAWVFGLRYNLFSDLCFAQTSSENFCASLQYFSLSLYWCWCQWKQYQMSKPSNALFLHFMQKIILAYCRFF